MEGFAFRVYIPALNGEVLRANQINQGVVFFVVLFAYVALS